jgi:hypothetical protein
LVKAPERHPGRKKTDVAPVRPATQPRNIPSCWDVGTIARSIMRTNPGIEPGALAEAVKQAQVLMGCRQAPQKTECSWIGSTWTCTTQ